MWTLIISGIKSLVSGYFEVKKSKQDNEAAHNRQALTGEQNWDLQAQNNAKHSWKDEIIMLIWYAPLVVGWYDPDKALAWVDFAGSLPLWWQFGAFGIMAASFGLRWYFKQQNFKVSEIMKGPQRDPDLGMKKD